VVAGSRESDEIVEISLQVWHKDASAPAQPERGS
jgi:hypothetical protein